MLLAEVHISLTRNYFFRSLPTLFPDIDRLIVLSKYTSGEVRGLEMLRENNRYREKELFGDNLKNFIVPEKERISFAWICKDDLPFIEKQTNSGQFNLFLELEHVILNLKIIVNVLEGEIIDIYYLFFREDQSNFGISRIDGVFDTAKKALVGSMLSKFIPLFYKYSNYEEDRFIKFTNVTKSMFEQHNQNDTDKLNMMRQWAEYFLENYNRPVGKNLILSEQALKILADKNFKTALNMLEKAAEYALMLNFDRQHDDIEIVSAYLLQETNEIKNDNEVQQATVKEVSPTLSKKYKVMKKLDDLETTAKKLFDNGEDLTGTAIGKAMDVPVSAPAITDYLHKNAKYIGILYNEYPDRWQIIRTHFRPLARIKDWEKNRVKKYS